MDTKATPATNNGLLHYPLVFVDHFSKYVLAAPLKQKVPDEAIAALTDTVWFNVGQPKMILPDYGNEFKADMIKATSRKFKARKTLTTPYNPQGNGLCKVRKKILTPSLLRYVISKWANGRIGRARQFFCTIQKPAKAQAKPRTRSSSGFRTQRG